MIRSAMERVWRAGMALPLALACTWVQAQSAGEAAVTRRAAELRDTPGETGRSLASLPAQQGLDYRRDHGADAGLAGSFCRFLQSNLHFSN